MPSIRPNSQQTKPGETEWVRANEKKNSVSWDVHKCSRWLEMAITIMHNAYHMFCIISICRPRERNLREKLGNANQMKEEGGQMGISLLYFILLYSCLFRNAQYIFVNITHIYHSVQEERLCMVHELSLFTARFRSLCRCIVDEVSRYNFIY